jgi:hypothetical protein
VSEFPERPSDYHRQQARTLIRLSGITADLSEAAALLQRAYRHLELADADKARTAPHLEQRSHQLGTAGHAGISQQQQVQPKKD